MRELEELGPGERAFCAEAKWGCGGEAPGTVDSRLACLAVWPRVAYDHPPVRLSSTEGRALSDQLWPPCA